MRYKAGVLGVVVIMIALSATLLGSWVMSMDVVEEKVVKYNELADIVGEFDSQQTPTFTEYNPSTNYTGYFTDDTIIGDARYFGGVDFQTSDPNNYRINYAPTSVIEDTIDLSGLESGRVALTYLATPLVSGINNGRPEAMTFQDLIIHMGLQQYDKVVFYNQSGIDWSNPTNWVAMCSKAMLDRDQSNHLFVKNPTVTPTIDDRYYRDIDWYDPIMVASYNANLGSVELFYDLEKTRSAGVFSTTQSYVLFGGTGDPGERFVIGESLQVSGEDIPPATYMDPSAGVVIL